MAAFKGWVCDVFGQLGGDSGGPRYILQTSDQEFLLLRMSERQPWDWDWELEYFSRGFVDVKGKFKPIEEDDEFGRTLEQLPFRSLLSGIIEVRNIERTGARMDRCGHC